MTGPALRHLSGRGPVVVAARVAAIGLGYLALARPRLVRWGATEDEVERVFPGHEIIPGAIRSATMATTIGAPPDRLWPWLIQMGHDRAGWYSWDRLDNFGRRSADRIHPEWQTLSVGDRLLAKPDGSQWWQVAALDHERFLCLRMSLDLAGRPFDPTGDRPRRYTDSTWGFQLLPLPGDRTRLVVSGYWLLEPRWLQAVLGVSVLEPSHWVMQTRQFAVLRRCVETSPPRGRLWRR